MADFLEHPRRDDEPELVYVGCVEQRCTETRMYGVSVGVEQIEELLAFEGWQKLDNPLADAAEEWGDAQPTRVGPHRCPKHRREG